MEAEWAAPVEDESRWYWAAESRWVALQVDKPSLTGCYGVVLRVGKLRLSATWPQTPR
jgi:hypothetical protein